MYALLNVFQAPTRLIDPKYSVVPTLKSTVAILESASSQYTLLYLPTKRLGWVKTNNKNNLSFSHVGIAVVKETNFSPTFSGLSSSADSAILRYSPWRHQKQSLD